MSETVLCPNHEFVAALDGDDKPVLLLTFALADVPALAQAPRPAVALALDAEGVLAVDFGQGLTVKFPPAHALDTSTLWVCALDNKGEVVSEASLIASVE